MMPASGVGPAARSAASSDFPTLDAVVAGHIRLALERSGGRVEGPRGVAAMLAVNPHTLRARMRRLGIDWSAYRRRLQRHGPNGQRGVQSDGGNH
jgi:hypothetical protein